MLCLRVFASSLSSHCAKSCVLKLKKREVKEIGPPTPEESVAFSTFFFLCLSLPHSLSLSLSLSLCLAPKWRNVFKRYYSIIIIHFACQRQQWQAASAAASSRPSARHSAAAAAPVQFSLGLSTFLSIFCVDYSLLSILSVPVCVCVCVVT